MKVSLNLIRDNNKQYSSAEDPLTDGIEVLLKRIGSQLGSIDSVDYTGSKYEGIVVAKVVDCDKHDDADKLHVCHINDGGVVANVERSEHGLVQVVCGAPNVRAGMLVAWIPPGVTVPNTLNKEPFVLGARDIRGQKSNGMLASAYELGINDNHEGILEIKVEDVGEELIKLGTPFKKLYGLDDVVIDIENKMFTHRPDCFGSLGIARELAGISGKKYTSPAWYQEPIKHDISKKAYTFQAKNEILPLVPRFMAQVVQNVTVTMSPLWLQSFLVRTGSRPINNIVDITNLFMTETAQPSHAFDYDKIKALSGSVATLMPRMAVDDEQLTLLNGKTIKLTKDDIVIATDKKAVALAGIMGGAETEVDDKTKNIIVECATFDMFAVRRTSMRHGLFSDASTRFTKGQSPLQNDRVLAKLVDYIVHQTNAEAATIVDIKSEEIKPKTPVTASVEFINARLGLHLNVAEMTALLQNVEFGLETKDNTLIVAPPFWRTDIEIPEDIVEEIGRLNGYDRLALELPQRSIRPAPKGHLIEFKNRIRNILSAAGANELLTYSFVHANLLEKVGQDKTKAFQLNNAISPDLQYFRMSLTPSLLDKVFPNIKSDMVRNDDNEFALFEIGKTHVKGLNDTTEPELPGEQNLISLVFAADDKTANRKYAGAAYYQAKKYLEHFLYDLGINFRIEPFDHEPHRVEGQVALAPFEPKRTAYVKVNDKLAGFVGEYKALTRRNLKLPTFSAGFELDLDVLVDPMPKSTYSALPKFPKVEQDISLKVATDTKYADLFDFLLGALNETKPENSFITLMPTDVYQNDSDGSHKNISWRLWLSAYDRTLRAEEVNSLLDAAAEKANQQFGAVRL